MTVTKLHTTPGDDLYEQLSPEGLSRAVVVSFNEDGGFSFMVSELDTSELALAASILQHHAAAYALGYGGGDE